MFIMALMGLVKDKVEWAVFPGFAIVLGLFFHTALLADGSITEVSGGIVTAIASASTDAASVWQAVEYVPAILTLTAFLITVYRVGSEFNRR